MTICGAFYSSEASKNTKTAKFPEKHAFEALFLWTLLRYVTGYY
jgi:hypothetical protein